MSHQYPPHQPYPQSGPPPQGYPPYPQQPGFHPPPQGFPQHAPYPQQPGFNGPPQGFHPGHGPPQGPPGQFGGQPQGYPQGPRPGFGSPPPHGPHGGPGFASPPGPHGGPVGGYPMGGPPMPMPSMPSLGYMPGQIAPGDFRGECDVLRKAMKGFGTDEKALIQVLAKLDPLQMAAVRSTYSNHIRRDLYKDVKSEAGGYLCQGLLAVIEGPLMYDVACIRDSLQGMGTKEWLLNDIVLGRSNADLQAIKDTYDRTYHRSLLADVEGDLSFKTLTLFTSVLRASRHEESAPLHPQTIEAETKSIHDATTGRMTNNVEEVCSIIARSSDNELRAINYAYQTRYNTSLEKHLEKEFSGHMKDAFLQMLRGALDPAMRDAVLLEDCMKGMGTKDEMLVTRVVRVHWNRQHLDQVKKAYQHKYKKSLVDRVKGETSGDYQKLMVALLE